MSDEKSFADPKDNSSKFVNWTHGSWVISKSIALLVTTFAAVFCGKQATKEIIEKYSVMISNSNSQKQSVNNKPTININLPKQLKSVTQVKSNDQKKMYEVLTEFVDTPGKWKGGFSDPLVNDNLRQNWAAELASKKPEERGATLFNLYSTVLESKGYNDASAKFGDTAKCLREKTGSDQESCLIDLKTELQQ